MSKQQPHPEQPLDDVKWVRFWETPGILAAEVIAGRLQTEGIPAWVWQQSAGAAMGLNYGPMGRGHVMVPEDQLELARQIMASNLSFENASGEHLVEDDEDFDGEQSGWFSKGILALTALAVSPLGVAAAFLVAKLFGGRDDTGSTCPDCETTVDLNGAEIKQGWYVCPECGRTVILSS
jgi:hypothetical protein